MLCQSGEDLLCLLIQLSECFFVKFKTSPTTTVRNISFISELFYRSTKVGHVFQSHFLVLSIPVIIIIIVQGVMFKWLTIVQYNFTFNFNSAGQEFNSAGQEFGTRTTSTEQYVFHRCLICCLVFLFASMCAVKSTARPRNGAI